MHFLEKGEEEIARVKDKDSARTLTPYERHCIGICAVGGVSNFLRNLIPRWNYRYSIFTPRKVTNPPRKCGLSRLIYYFPVHEIGKL